MASRECDTSDNGAEFQNIRVENSNDKRTSGPSTLKMDVKGAEVKKLMLETRRVTIRCHCLDSNDEVEMSLSELLRTQ